MLTSLFDYHLPPEQIAQTPMKPRDHARLLVLGRETGDVANKHVYDLPDLLAPGDLLVLNDSRVFKARLRANCHGKKMEIFLLRPDERFWLALAKPAKKIRIGDTLTFNGDAAATLKEKLADGTVLLDFHMPPNDVFALTDRIGEVPTPPYVREASASERYQTIYAKTTGSIAAPTAGLHFTNDLFRCLGGRGIRHAFVTLHVGLGTFRPIKTKTLETHDMHEEWANVPQQTCNAIEETKKRGGRIISVGTTTLRALESSCPLKATHGFTRLFITPGYEFRMADGLLTNFHLPKSTLLVLVSAFAGRERVLHAYAHAVRNGYRFYSFGDAMLIM